MKAVLITELDQLKEFPVGYILKSTEFNCAAFSQMG